MKWIVVAIILLIPSIPYSFSDDIIVVDGGSIQNAIDNAENGDTIYVMEGIYHENIVVDKKVSIIGKGAVIDGDGDTVAVIKSDDVLLSNISLTNSSNAIIYVDGKNFMLKGCEIYRGKYGVEANHSTIENCIFHECGGGALLHSNNIVINSTFFKCGLGIEVRGESNVMAGCDAHTCGVGIYMENASNNAIEKCSIYKNNNNQGDIFFLRSSHNTVEGCSIEYGSFGIRMVESNYNRISENSVYGSRYGIKMEGCRSNIIRGCILEKTRFALTAEKCREIVFNYNKIEHAHMYSMDAKYSSIDARFNWWGSIIPKKLHILFSNVKIFPWFFGGDNVHKSLREDEDNAIKSIKENIHIPREEISVTGGDMDPMVDVKIKVEILRARSFNGRHPFALAVNIDGKENESRMEGDVLYPATFWQDVDDGERYVPIEMSIGNKAKGLMYDIATGDWYGDDYLGDGDGYGHIKFENAEIWFNIGYNDYDGDGLTYWEEVAIYNTSPAIDDRGMDSDGDGIPIEWEDKYGFNPFVAENHSIDYDKDGLNDYEEYYMREMLSDPFSKDIFVEADYMPRYKMPEESIEMIYDVFAFHNITMHIDVDEEIPYMERVYYGDARDLYWKYFLHGDVNNPRHGIFHYLLLISYGSSNRGGHVFVGFDNCDSVLLACQYINDWRMGEARNLAYATLFMHELGHNLGIFEDTFGGVDNESCNVPWHRGYWKYADYKSCMNYRYAFQLLDYSDGSHGTNDFNDWGNIKLDFFKDSYYYP